MHVSMVKIKTWASIWSLLHAEENSNMSLGHFSRHLQFWVFQ